MLLARASPDSSFRRASRSFPLLVYFNSWFSVGLPPVFPSVFRLSLSVGLPLLLGLCVLGSGEEGYSSVACLSLLTIDHAYRSRRSTVPLPNRYSSKIWALIFFFHVLHAFFFLFLLSPSCFARCGHHLSLRMAIASSLLPTVVY